MKITMYELLGMVKDGKAPKRIRFLNHYYIWKENDEDYQKEDGLMLFGNIKINYILNSEVEILEEEKKIPEKLENKKEFYYYVRYTEYKDEIDKVIYILKAINLTEEKIDNLNNSINSIIDYLKSKGE